VLTITVNAADAIREVVATSEAPDGGLRIFTQPVNDTEVTLDMSVAGDAEVGDEVLEGEGARLFLEPTAARYLEDKVLDAESEGDTVRFSINNLQGNSNNGQPG
jgi:iron-sulfur cluster assembly protein